MQISFRQNDVNSWYSESLSKPAQVQKRDKMSDFLKYNTLEIRLFTPEKRQFSSSTLDPATDGNPYGCKGFSVSGETAETETRHKNSPFQCD